MTIYDTNDLWLINAAVFTNTQQFTSPGTWTCPSTTTWVEVIVVGGGGGGGTGQAGGNNGGGGGGGAVIRKWLPVSGPVPVTVGAGGTGATVTPVSPLVNATAGGVSYFGPSSPPLPTTVAYAGGGGGAKSGPAPADPAPPLNGGGGGGVPSGFVVIGVGVLGSPNCGEVGGGARGSIRGPVFQNSFGYLSYGGGGVPVKSPVADLSTVYGSGVGFNPSTGNGNAGTANTGGGGAGGGTAGPGYNGGNGGSGIVIVRWRQ